MGKLGQWYRQVVQSPSVVVGALIVAFGCWGYVASSVTVPVPVAASLIAAQPPLLRQVRSAATELPVDCARVPCMALTFDDGPNATITPQILDILDRHQARATFFLIGSHIAGNEEIVRRIQRSGHEIGNHTWSHRNLSTLSPQEVEAEIGQTQATITAIGVPAPHVMRPPYGEADTMVRSHTPLAVVMWNVDPEDWHAKKPEKIVEHIVAHAKPGAIVDLHDIWQVTADSLDPILSSLEQTYHLVTVSELLDLPPNQPGVFYAR